MPVAIFAALECVEATDMPSADECRLQLRPDGGPPRAARRTLGIGDRWVLDESMPFRDQVALELWEEDPRGDSLLGRFAITDEPRPRGTWEVRPDGRTKYVLWYEVVPDGTDRPSFLRPDPLSLRDNLRQLGRGALDARVHDDLVGQAAIYRASQVVSVREAMRRHAPQDGDRGDTTSLERWLRRHANPWGEEAVVPVEDTPEAFTPAEIAGGAPNWVPVVDERSRRVAGFQQFSRQTRHDNPLRHKTLDWLADLLPDPEYAYLLDYTSKRVDVRDLGVPVLHNEWETGSVPLEWRPFWGEHVTLEGRHIFDVGHLPVHTEIHPIHTVVRQHTTAGPLGDGGALVPVNRAVIGVGASGGFPEVVGSRWRDEAGEDPPAWAEGNDLDHCWYTSLARHPVSFPLFPPVSRPSPDAELRSRVVLCEVIEVPDGPGVARFLRHCQHDDPAAGGAGLAFRRWDRAAGLPTATPPRQAPPALEPRRTRRDGSWFDVTVDLATVDGIAVGYYAVVECGWSERGPHTLREYEVTFEQLTAHVVSDLLHGDWHLYYGVNGQWEDWYTDDEVRAGDTFDHGRTFRVWVLDDMPLLVRDCGIEWEGIDFGNEYLDRVELTLPGPDHLGAVARQPGVHDAVRDHDGVSFRALAWEMAEGATRHEWDMRVRQARVVSGGGA